MVASPGHSVTQSLTVLLIALRVGVVARARSTSAGGNFAVANDTGHDADPGAIERGYFDSGEVVEGVFVLVA